MSSKYENKLLLVPLPDGSSRIVLEDGDEALLANAMQQESFLKMADVVSATSLSKSRLYHLISIQAFPSPVKVGGSSLWSSKAVQAWMVAQLPRP